jgi:hypothetical protein
MEWNLQPPLPRDRSVDRDRNESRTCDQAAAQNGKKERVMTTFAQWARPGSRLEAARARPKKYDIRIVDQFHGYCMAVARTHRHREEARGESQFATRRTLATLVLAGGMLCYYLLERFSLLAFLL